MIGMQNYSKKRTHPQFIATEVVSVYPPNQEKHADGNNGYKYKRYLCTFFTFAFTCL